MEIPIVPPQCPSSLIMNQCLLQEVASREETSWLAARCSENKAPPLPHTLCLSLSLSLSLAHTLSQSSQQPHIEVGGVWGERGRKRMEEQSFEDQRENEAQLRVGVSAARW